jgi:hypothetical protein
MYHKKMSVWIDRPEVLFEKLDIWPNEDDGTIERVNRISRFILVAFTMLSIYRKRTKYIVVGILFAVVVGMYGKKIHKENRQDVKIKDVNTVDMINTDDINDTIVDMGESADDRDHINTFAHTLYGQINHNRKNLI